MPRMDTDMIRLASRLGSAALLSIALACPAAAEETRATIYIAGANPFAVDHSPDVAMLGGWGGRIWRKIKGVTDDLSDFFEEFEDTVVSIGSDLGDTVADLAGFTVTIKGQIQGSLLDGFKDIIDHRPEWMADPPWWVNQLSQMYLGVSMDVIDTGVTLAVDAKSGGFAWNDATKALVLKTVVHEGLVRLKPGVKFVATSVAPEPTLAILIDSTIEYGFDRLEDMADDRISQHFKPGNPGDASAQEIVASGQAVTVEYQSGVVLTSVTVANQVVIGGATDGGLTVVAPLNGTDRPSYIVAVGGAPVILSTGAVVLGNVVIQTAPTSSAIPAAVKDRAAEITAAAQDGKAWVDNTMPAIIAGSSGG